MNESYKELFDAEEYLIIYRNRNEKDAGINIKKYFGGSNGNNFDLETSQRIIIIAQ